MSPWTPSAEVVPATALDDVLARWKTLEQRWPTLVRVLRPGERVVAGEESVGIAPALAGLVGSFPGVALGGVELDWPHGASQHWPELGADRFGHQPVWASGRVAVVVRIDPEGRAGDVLHVRGDGGIDLEAGGVDLVAPDVVTWWRRLTAWVEGALPDLAEEVGAEVGDPEEMQLALEEALEQELLAWLGSGGVQE